MALVKHPNRIRLAMLGMVDGNGHPYSWSAIINGDYDPQPILDGGYPGIIQYLSAQPKGALGIDGVKVTHVWCDDPADAARVAKAAKIANIVEKPEDVIGKVDAVVIPTDKGWEHLARAKPFIEAGMPLFIDKPLTDREDHLRQFVRWHRQGKIFLSTSAMRYSREFALLRQRLSEVGQMRLLTITTHKSWERYGIHALEAVYPFLAPGGWLSVSNTGSPEANIVHARHRDGVEIVLAAIQDLVGAFGILSVCGTHGYLSGRFSDSFHAFKKQLEVFVDYLRTGNPPFDFSQTVEQMKIIIAGIRSRDQAGRKVSLEEIEV
ncbi:MAG: Gfo/Idh/MocA family oxidoreductase [Pirellulales bacterium]|nr:Gfo/Idh/MocA family oxidoreductase [Pirellulales bacterium]